MRGDFSTMSSSPVVVCGDTRRPVPSLQALKDLGSAASVTLFFHESDGGLPGRAALCVRTCTRALAPFLEATLCSFCAGVEVTELLGPVLLGLDPFFCFFSSPTATIKKTNPSTMATSYITSQCLCLSLPYHDIPGRHWLHKKRRQTNGLPWTVTYAPSAITFNCNL